MSAPAPAASVPVKPNEEDHVHWVYKPKDPGFVSGDYVGYTSPESLSEKIKRKSKANPLVPMGIALTITALTVGLMAMRSGNQVMSQRMMRARVAAQGFTICALVGGILYAGAIAK